MRQEQEKVKTFFIERFGLEYPNTHKEYVSRIFDDCINNHKEINSLLGLNPNNEYRKVKEIQSIEETPLYYMLCKLQNMGYTIDFINKSIDKIKISKFCKKNIANLELKNIILNGLNIQYDIKELNKEATDKLIDTSVAQMVQQTFINGKLIISTNPVDYLYSSNIFCSYTSCFAPDGQYSSSSVAYMRSSNTTISYITTHNAIENIGGNIPHKNSRVWLYINPNSSSFYIGRGYNTNEGVFKEIRNFVYSLLDNQDKLWKVRRDITPNVNIPVATTYGLERCYMDTNFLYIHEDGVDIQPFYFTIEKCLCPYCGSLTDKVWDLDSCCSDAYIYCDCCGDLLTHDEIRYNTSDNIVFYNDSYHILCDDCLINNYTRCNDCDMYYPNEYTFIVEDIDAHVCDECINNGKYAYCYECGCVFLAKNCKEYKGDYFCEDCYEMIKKEDEEENEEENKNN